MILNYVLFLKGILSTNKPRRVKSKKKKGGSRFIGKTPQKRQKSNNTNSKVEINEEKN